MSTSALPPHAGHRPGGLLCRPELLCLAFLVGIFPLIYRFVLFHPDEIHYVDAGLQMVQSGDYLTPRTAEGLLRFKKPIIPYWFVTSGIHAVGVSPLGIRLVFALAGALLVAVAWRMALTVHGSSLAAIAAAGFTMVHPSLLISAPRAVPDICLALFLAISLLGFLRLAQQQTAGTWPLLCAYGGGALAVLSKGVPALALIVVATAFLLLRRRRLLVHAPWRWATVIAAATALGSSWFLMMNQLHGEALRAEFLEDQVGRKRFAASPLQMVLNVPALAGVLVLTFAGPLLILLPHRQQFKRVVADWMPRAEIQLLLLWCASYLAMASTINSVNIRYLLPLVTPLAVLAGGLAAAVPERLLAASLRRWMILLAVAVGLFGMLFFLLHRDDAALLGLLVPTSLLAGLIWLIRTAPRRCGAELLGGLSAAWLLAVGMTFWGLYPVLVPRPCETLANRLEQLADDRAVLLDDVTVGTSLVGSDQRALPLSLVGDRGSNFASRLRVACGGRRQVVRLSTLAEPPDRNQYAAVVATSRHSPLVAQLETTTLEPIPLRIDHRVAWTITHSHFRQPLSQTVAEHHQSGVFAR